MQSPSSLALVLHSTSNMHSLARSISRRRQKHKRHAHLHRHPRPAERWRARRRPQPLNSILRHTLRSRLQRRPNYTRRDRIHADTFRRLLLRERACEGGNGAFGRAVVNHGWVAGVAGDGAAVDYHGTAWHVRQGIFADGHHGDDVEFEGLLDDVEVDVGVVHADFLLGG
jgi:hypothetical protein